jgi:ABC-type transport system involved in cytochrome c biogenesis permease subunit
MREISSNEGIVLGQKYAYATAALMVGIAGYIQLLGIERAILAIIFAYLALRSSPAPRLEDRRLWAKVGLALGVIMLVLVPTIVIVKFDALREVITGLQKLQ